MVPEDATDWLARVAVDKRLLFEDKQREVADLMLSNNIVLRYKNSEEWFDLHPALRQAPHIKLAIKRVRDERAKPIG
jgi:hypothetical protein